MRYEVKPYPGGFIIYDSHAKTWLSKDETWHESPYEVRKFETQGQAQTFVDKLPQ